MTLDKQLLLEGLAIHVGQQSALECQTRFYDLYVQKHGTCLDTITICPYDKEAGTTYMNRQDKVFRRYVLLWAYAKTTDKEWRGAEL